METLIKNSLKFAQVGIPLNKKEKDVMNKLLLELQPMEDQEEEINKLQDILVQDQILTDQLNEREAFLKKYAFWESKIVLNAEKLDMCNKLREELEKDYQRLSTLLKSGSLDQVTKGRVKQTKASFKELLQKSLYPDHNGCIRDTEKYKKAIAEHQQALMDQKFKNLVQQAGGRLVNQEAFDRDGHKYYLVVFKNSPRITAIVTSHQNSETQLRITGNNLLQDEDQIPTIHQGEKSGRIAVPIRKIELFEIGGKYEISPTMLYNWELCDVVNQLLDVTN